MSNSSPLIRFTKASIGAAIITAAIFFLMQLLVAEHESLALDESAYRYIPIVPAERKPPEPERKTYPRPEDNPEPERPDVIDKITGNREPGVIPNFPTQKIGTEGGITTTNSTLVPWVKVTPIYPNRPQIEGIEGFVVLEFTVDENGKVIDIVVLEETPKGYGFARSAVKAAEKFHYKPRIVNGKAVATIGIREMFEYKLKDEG